MHTMTSADRILGTFAELGLRRTAPRRAIAEWLSKASTQGRDFTAEDLWRDLLQGEQPGGRATVFRTLEALERNGILDRIERADGSRRYRVCGIGVHHHHIACVECGRVSEVRSACLSPQTFEAIEGETGFSVERHSIELFGRCGMCQGEMTKKAQAG